MLRLWKTSGRYKDFRNFFHKVLSEAFHHYTTVLVSLCGKEAQDLQATLIEFCSNIYELSMVYEWQDTVLLMSIEGHKYIVTQQPTEPSKWVIPEKFQGKFCTARTIIGMRATTTNNKRRRLKSPPSRRVKSSGGPNNPSLTCDLFNKGDCHWSPCERAHKCRGYGSKDHGLSRKGKFGAGGMGITVEPIDIVEVASLANGNSLRQFLRVFPSLSAPPRLNTAIEFRLATDQFPLFVKTKLLGRPLA